eukprot:c4865_g1_i1.p1 GENE.c4865_g1_i1~~c4865_g1_i1.p1  ORF type:complete len:141 (-),score=41.11 c4865_g1_i1:26-448(-)
MLIRNYLLLCSILSVCFAGNFTFLSQCSVGASQECAVAVKSYCETNNWPAICADVRVSCPFSSTDLGDVKSPCSVTACTGESPDDTACETAINKYCEYHNNHLKRSSGYDSLCSKISTSSAVSLSAFFAIFISLLIHLFI